MSFSSDIKEEILNKIENISKKCCIEAETFGEKITQLEHKNKIEDTKFLDISKLNECCIKSILKGCFLSSGYLTNPASDYRLEIIFKNLSIAKYFSNLLNILDMSPKISKKKNSNSYVLYILDSNQIAIYLAITDVIKGLLEFENIRAEKELNNNLNRQENIKTANMTKTIKTAMKQIEKINSLKEKGTFNLLDEKLLLVANARVEFPYLSLEELSKKISISKSGLKHRLDKIMEIEYSS